MVRFGPTIPTLPATDIDRARNFYEKRLGLKVRTNGSDGGFLFDVGKNAHVYVYPTQAKRGENTAAAFRVDDVEKAAKELRANGITFEDYDMPGLKTVKGIATLPDMKAAWFKDSEGNILCINDMPI